MSLNTFFTPPEVAKTLRVSPGKVLGWIRRAELEAVNVGEGVRPRYRVSDDNLRAFLEARKVQPPPLRQRRRQQAPKGGPIHPSVGESLLKKKNAVKIGNEYFRVWNGVTLFY